ncbi:MAG: hypothetical protein AcusKO_22330 [Acuticoccus sp.]
MSGALAALMLAERGCAVDLYDAAATPLAGASRNCEGKIHLGFVYGLDPSLRTVRRLLRGALTFRPILARYVEAATLDKALSDPFLYAVPTSSMLAPAAVEAHFARVGEAVDDLAGEVGRAYPGLDATAFWEPLARPEREALFDGASIAACYTTAERAFDPAPLADSLAATLAATPGIRLVLGTRVSDVVPADGGGYRITAQDRDGERQATYTHVVNATWQERLALDRAVLGVPRRPVIHRYKVGFRTRLEHGAPPPTVTFVSGAYGDIVHYDGTVYASWYPVGLLRQERALAPERPPPDPAAEATLLADTLAGLGGFTADGGRWADGAGPWQPLGGYITSWGESGIEDPSSELHERHDIGPHGTASYQSIDTGKFTTAPLFAQMATQRILGLA